MKNLGFTLAEIIATLGIIGILAAITAPMLGSLTPDQDKIKVLKTYKVLNDITTEVLNDPSLYDRTNNNCEGLSCTEQPTHPDFIDNPNFIGKDKFSYILASKLDLSTNAAAAGNSIVFTTVDGIEWTSASNEIGENLQGYNITIDLDNAGSNRTFDENSNNPDRFSFEVDLRGNIRGRDSLTRAYLANPNKLNDKKADYAQALNAN